jgi:hypothetical protein
MRPVIRSRRVRTFDPPLDSDQSAYAVIGSTVHQIDGAERHSAHLKEPAVPVVEGTACCSAGGAGQIGGDDVGGVPVEGDAGAHWWSQIFKRSESVCGVAVSAVARDSVEVFARRL